MGCLQKKWQSADCQRIEVYLPIPQQVFTFTYLFGAFSPLNGDKFLMEYPRCNAEVFQCFVFELAKQNPKKLKLLVLDKAAFHKAAKIKIPYNIALIFQPSYAPGAKSR